MSESPATKMCQFKYTRHSCGHILPKLEVNQDPSCKLCVPVLVGLKYYHDQPLHECIENAFRQAPLRIPRPCRPVGPNTPFDSEELIHACGRDWRQFEETMHRLGVTLEERNSVEALALRHNQTSNRDTNVPLRPVGHNVLRYMMELEKWQHRQFQPPNIIFDTVSWGCGGTGPGVQGHCLVGWTGQGILMYRHGIWNVNPPHSFGTWSPQPVGYLYINYGEAPILQLPKDGDWRAKATRTLIDIPMYSCLYAVLSGRPSGPLIENDEGYLVPALGASGPEIIRPHLPPLPPPTSSVLPLPQLAMSSMHKGQPRPRQAFVPAARSRRGPGHRYSATWNSPTSFNEAEGRPKPNESQKQMTYKGGYSQSKTKAGPNQSVDRAKINTKIKQLPQQRVSRSGTPATTASTGIPQPMSSTHPTPGSTRPATSTGNVAQSDEPTIGLGIIDESSPAAPLEDTVGNAEDTVLYQPPRHPIPQSHEAQAHEAGTSTSVSEGKKPMRPVSSRQHSHSPHSTTKPPPPEDEALSLSSNMLIGASQPPTRPTTPPHTSQPIYAQQQEQQVPGVTYTLNPTAEAFEPASGGAEEGEGRSIDE